MNRVSAVEAREGHAIWLRFSDGTEGEVDLSDIDRTGVFSAWDDRSTFEAVSVGPAGCVAWPGDIELCPDSLFLRLTGTRPEELFPRTAPTPANA